MPYYAFSIDRSMHAWATAEPACVKKKCIISADSNCSTIRNCNLLLCFVFPKQIPKVVNAVNLALAQGWLVVWGNVLGGVIGVISLASGLQLGGSGGCGA